LIERNSKLLFTAIDDEERARELEGQPNLDRFFHLSHIQVDFRQRRSRDGAIITSEHQMMINERTGDVTYEPLSQTSLGTLAGPAEGVIFGIQSP
jgi:hypothetical protein